MSLNEIEETGKKKRVLVVGLDGVTFDILQPWLKDGSLPTLAKLINEGSYGTLSSTVPSLTAPAWSSFITGMNPGKHGVLNFFKVLPGEADHSAERYVPVNSTTIRSETLWGILSRQGYRIGVMNVPMTYPPRPVNGFMVTGMLTPQGAVDFTYPPELAKGIPDYRVDLEYFLGEEMSRHESLPQLDHLIEELRNLLDLRADAVKTLMAREAWDFFMVVFTGTDRLGHFLWPYHVQPKDPSSSNAHLVLHRSVRSYYQRLDEILADMLQLTGEDVSVLLVSDHGMGSTSRKVVYLNQWLLESGFLKLLPLKSSWKNINRWLTAFGLSRDRLTRIKEIAVSFKPLRRFATRLTRTALPIHHDVSQAYFRTIYVTVGGIHIEDHCKHNPEEYQQLCSSIITTLRNINSSAAQSSMGLKILEILRRVIRS
jgi:predicted AlkP superfamily phosphohydrolase/phosphomutase